MYVLRIGCGCCFDSVVYRSKQAALKALLKCKSKDPYWSMLLCDVKEVDGGRFEGIGYHNGAPYDVMASEIKAHNWRAAK
jgi:hypothetical protein